MVGGKVKLKVKMMVSRPYPVDVSSSSLASSGEH
jgi:hypothetical protein